MNPIHAVLMSHRTELDRLATRILKLENPRTVYVVMNQAELVGVYDNDYDANACRNSFGACRSVIGILEILLNTRVDSASISTTKELPMPVTTNIPITQSEKYSRGYTDALVILSNRLTMVREAELSDNPASEYLEGLAFAINTISDILVSWSKRV